MGAEVTYYVRCLKVDYEWVEVSAVTTDGAVEEAISLGRTPANPIRVEDSVYAIPDYEDIYYSRRY